jgi:hypothetical protein
MTTISEIARLADVPVESVLRVLNRDTVSSDVAERVLAAMGASGYHPRVAPASETNKAEPAGAADRPPSRAVVGEVVDHERPRAAEADDAVERAREELLQAVGDVVNELENPQSRDRSSGGDALRVLADRVRTLDARFERVARDVESMKRELVRARSERLEDLTLLVDLITTSWRSADRRLGRIDRKLERIEDQPGRLPSAGPRSLGQARWEDPDS